MTKFTEHDLRRFIENGESNTIELKIASPRPVEMAERLCGMANAQGGVVIIGVEDAERKIVGVPAERMALTVDVILRATRRIIRPMLILDPPEPEIYQLDGKNLVVATVPPGQGTVHQISGVFWVRRGTCTIPLDIWELLELVNDRGLQDWELLPTPNTSLEDLDFDKIENYLAQRALQYGYDRYINLQKALKGMKCITSNRCGDIVPTNAGVLFFGKRPQEHIAQSEIVCVLRQDTLGISRYADLQIIRGTLQELVDGTEKFLKRYLGLRSDRKNCGEPYIPEYPIKALREAVINAVIHRDYSKRGESIRVIYYADRIEIRSPGLLLPGITIDMLQQGNMFSKLRNPVLANLLRDIPGYVERIGSGTSFMIEESHHSGCPLPQFQEASEFIVIFRTAAIQRELFEYEENRASMKDVDVGVLSSQELNERNNRLVKAIDYVSHHGHITNRTYRELVGISDKAALYDLSILVNRGALKRVGKGRAQGYELP